MQHIRTAILGAIACIALTTPAVASAETDGCVRGEVFKPCTVTALTEPEGSEEPGDNDGPVSDPALERDNAGLGIAPQMGPPRLDDSQAIQPPNDAPPKEDSGGLGLPTDPRGEQ